MVRGLTPKQCPHSLGGMCSTVCAKSASTNPTGLPVGVGQCVNGWATLRQKVFCKLGDLLALCRFIASRSCNNIRDKCLRIVLRSLCHLLGNTFSYLMIRTGIQNIIIPMPILPWSVRKITVLIFETLKGICPTPWAEYIGSPVKTTSEIIVNIGVLS